MNQLNQRSKTVIGSILKPLDDVRHYQKLGISVAKLPNVDVHILGRAVTYSFTSKEPNIAFHPIVSSQPSVIERLAAPWKFLAYLVKVKPEQAVVCTYELLLVTILYKILFGTKIVYDVQENYTNNIRSNDRFGAITKNVFSNFIRFKEHLCAPLVDQFWLAEDCYEQELPFVKGKNIVLENKSLYFRPAVAVSLADKPSINLLFSGTIAKENGIFEAIGLAIALNGLESRYHLTIIGCCHQPDTAKELEKLTIAHKAFITLIYSTIPLEYRLIQENVLKADIGLICYRKQSNFKDKMPTKLYEYTTAGLPILLQQNPLWEHFCQDFDNAIMVDYQNIEVKETHEHIQSKLFYPNGNDQAKQHTWASEEQKLINRS